MATEQQRTPMNPDELVEREVAEPADATTNNPLGRPDVENVDIEKREVKGGHSSKAGTKSDK